MVYNNCVTIYGEDSRNSYGEQVWGSGTQYKARVIEKSDEILDLRGERTMSDILVHLPLGLYDDVEVGQKVGFSGTNYIVLGVSKPKNEVGHNRDIKLTCKKYGES
jgi:hypothetical protein